MVKVAIAGATGSLGRSIAESIAATKKHELVLLSRSQNDPELEKLGAKVVPISYTDPTSLDRALTGVHTVISVIFAPDAEVFVSSHLALLDAAVRAGAKRFAPSEWNLAVLHNSTLGLYKPKAVVADAVRKSGLEYTFYENGVFMNYFGYGTPGSGYVNNFGFAVDLGSCTASIPGDGQNKMAFTLTKDIGEFVAASLDLDTWPEVSMMGGDLKSYNEVVSLAEDIRGKKFDVTYTSVAALTSQLHSNPPSIITNALTDVKIAVATTSFEPKDLNLNILLPQVKPTGLEEYLREWWGKADN